MEFKGTKGEWYLSKDSLNVECESVSGLVASVWGLYKSDEVEIRNEGESWLAMRERYKPIREEKAKEAKANAQLIVSAPDLLSALINLLESNTHLELDLDSVEKAELAIKNALRQSI